MSSSAGTRTSLRVATVLILGGIVCGVPPLRGADRALDGESEKTAPTRNVRLEGSVREIAPADWPPNPSPDRSIVTLDVAIDDAVLSELADHGRIHGWVDRYRFVAMTPRSAEDRAAVAALPYVRDLSPDAAGGLSAVGTWDLDIIDAVDVEESGAPLDPGNPDRREVQETGAGVHVAVIDTGLVNAWREFLHEDRVDAGLARAFVGANDVTSPPVNNFNAQSGLWEHDNCHHGLQVSGPIIGSRFIEDLDGVAPGARIIPLKVSENDCFRLHLSTVVAAVEYATRLAETGAVDRLVVNMSLGFSEPVPLLETAIDDAVAAGVIVVAAAGNSGETGMGWPASYPRVIAAGAAGWTQQFRPGTVGAFNDLFFWSLDVPYDPDPRRPPREESEAFVPPFSSRAIAALGQELDVVAPGVNVVVPWGQSSGGFLWVYGSGTSFSSPLTAGVAALMLEKNPALRQAEVEAILRQSALPVAAIDSRSGILFGFAGFEGSADWDDDCDGRPCDAVGAGLLRADGALALTPRPSRR